MARPREGLEWVIAHLLGEELDEELDPLVGPVVLDV